MISGFPDLARKLGKVPDNVQKATIDAVAAAAATLVASVTAASGPYAGRPIARVRMKMTPGIPVATVFMSSRRAHLLDHDTKAVPEILPGSMTGHRRRALALFIPGSPNPVAYSHRGPTRGRFMWEVGLANALPNMENTLTAAPWTGVLKAFGL